MSDSKTGNGRQITLEEVSFLQRIDLLLTVRSLSEDKFIQDLKFSFAKYGDRMYVSAPQVQWINKLHDRVVESLGDLLRMDIFPSKQTEYVPDDAEF